MIQNTKRLSAALATYNEEKSIKNCLESISGLVDEIVIVDGTSIDKTVEIAKQFNAKIIITGNKPIFHLNKQEAIDECLGEWILQLDADEIVTPELAKEIKEVIGNSDNQSPITNHQSPITDHCPVAYWIKRKKMFLGKWMKRGGQYPDPVIRLFRKGKAYLPCKSVHEQMIVEGETGMLINPMIHLPNLDFSSYILKDDRYSTLTMNEFKEKKIKLNFLSFFKYFFCEPFCVFFSIFIRHRGFLDGFPGFVFAFYSGLHRFTAYVKYWEVVNNKNKNLI